MPAGDPFTHEIALAAPPDEAMRELVLRDVPEFEQLRYRVESRTPDVLVLRRSYTPRKAWSIPLSIAGSFVVVCALTGGMTLFALIALVFLILAGALALVVRLAERITITLSAEGAGTRGLITGRATHRMANRLRATDIPASPASTT